MASKKSDHDLIAQVVRELEAAGEEFTFDPAEAMLAVQTTAKQPRLGPGDRMDSADVRRILVAFGPAAVAALADVAGDLDVLGDERVFWVERNEGGSPIADRFNVVFDGRCWVDAPAGPEGLQAVLATLTLNLDDKDVRQSILLAATPSWAR